MLKTTETQTVLINTAVIVIGSYHLPVSVAGGALIGASMFIARRQNYPVFYKAWLFMVSFFCGVFGSDTVDGLVAHFLPQHAGLHINGFIGALLASAFAVLLVEYLYSWIEQHFAAQKKE